MDGTLVDSSDSILCAANQALETAGLLAMDLAELLPLIGIPIRKIFHLRTTDEPTLDALVAAYRSAYAQCQRMTTINPGIAALLDRLTSAGVCQVIVTTKAEHVALGVLRDLGLDRHFAGVVGDDGRRPLKPSPLPMVDACKLAGVRPEEAVMVGDTLHDWESARGAGVPFVGVSWGYGAADSLRKVGLRVCDDASQLAEALGLRP